MIKSNGRGIEIQIETELFGVATLMYECLKRLKHIDEHRLVPKMMDLMKNMKLRHCIDLPNDLQKQLIIRQLVRIP